MHDRLLAAANVPADRRDELVDLLVGVLASIASRTHARMWSSRMSSATGSDAAVTADSWSRTAAQAVSSL